MSSSGGDRGGSDSGVSWIGVFFISLILWLPWIVDAWKAENEALKAKVRELEAAATTRAAKTASPENGESK